MSSPIIWAGTAAKSLKSIFQLPGSTSGTLSLTPNAATTSHTLTFPAAQGGAATVLTNDGAGALTWAANGSALLATNTKTGNYTLLTSDSFISGSASGGAFTLTLPTAVGNAGKIFYLSRSDQTLANAITIATTSSQTIGSYGTSVTMATQGESWMLVSDGTNWQVLDHGIPMVWTGFTPGTQGLGTPTITVADWCRIGAEYHFRFRGTTGTCTNVEARINFPTGLTGVTLAATLQAGPGMASNFASASVVYPLIASGATFFNFGLGNAATNALTIINGTGGFGNAGPFSFQGRASIAGWNG